MSADYDALVAALGTEDVWYTFRRRADAFIEAYESLSPDPTILEYRKDLKWIVGFIQYATPIMDKEPAPDLSDVSGKIRRLLEEHLEVTGIRTIVKLRHITDPDFWTDFDTDKPAKELRRATIRKATELKKITYDRVEENPLRYQKFSERVLEVIRRFEAGQLAAAEALKAFEEITRDLQDEERAHESSGLNERAYGVLKILESLAWPDGASPTVDRVAESRPSYAHGSNDDRLTTLAHEIDTLYANDGSAPAGWHLKEQLRRELRQQVRHRSHQAGIQEVKEVAARVEEYALRHYVKVS
jgi:type I restriction enzyme R subunit